MYSNANCIAYNDKFELRSPTSVTGSCISVIIAKCQKSLGLYGSCVFMVYRYNWPNRYRLFLHIVCWVRNVTYYIVTYFNSLKCNHSYIYLLYKPYVLLCVCISLYSLPLHSSVTGTILIRKL